MKAVGELSGGHGAGRTREQIFLLTPAVQGEFVFDGAKGKVQVQFINAVLIGIQHGRTGTAPSVETTIEVNGRKGGAGVTVHIHPETDSTGTGRTGAGIAGAVAGGREAEGAVDNNLTVGEPKGGIGAGRTGDQGFLGCPTVDGEFVFKCVGGQGDGEFPNRVVVGIGHGRAGSAPSIEVSVQKDPVDGGGSVVIRHINAEYNRVGGLGLGFEFNALA